MRSLSLSLSLSLSVCVCVCVCVALNEEGRCVQVQALKDVGKEDPERWAKVSALIGTRTKVECLRHFKEMREKIKAKKETA